MHLYGRETEQLRRHADGVGSDRFSSSAEFASLIPTNKEVLLRSSVCSDVFG